MSLAEAGPLRPFRRAEYDRMVELGFFAEERVELIDGILVSMSPQSGRHATSVAKLNMLLVPAVIGRAEVRVQSPFAASEHSEPEPDLAIVPLGNYVLEHPSRAFLIIEVSDDSLPKDRGPKSLTYAAAGVPEYWIVDLRADVIEVRRSPEGQSYRDVARYDRAATLQLLAFPDVTVRVADIIPPR